MANSYLESLGAPSNAVEAAIMWGAGADIDPPVAYDRDDALRLAQAQAIRDGGGSGGGMLVVNAVYSEETSGYTLDKTAGEIYAACPFVVAVEEDNGFAVYQLREYFLSNDEGYRFGFMGSEILTFIAASADDYPTEDTGGGGGGDA